MAFSNSLDSAAAHEPPPAFDSDAFEAAPGACVRGSLLSLLQVPCLKHCSACSCSASNPVQEQPAAGALPQTLSVSSLLQVPCLRPCPRAAYRSGCLASCHTRACAHDLCTACLHAEYQPDSQHFKSCLARSLPTWLAVYIVFCSLQSEPPGSDADRYTNIN